MAESLAEKAIAPTSRLFGEYLDLPADTISDALTVQAAFREQGRETPTRLGEVLLDMGVLDLDTLLEAIQAQRVDRLAACRLFRSLSREDLTDLSAVFQEVSLPPGQQFITQDEKDPCVYVLAAGRLEVFRRDDKDGEVRLAAVFPGEPVGEMGYFSNSIRSASVRTRDTSQLLRARYEDLTDCFESVPSVAQAFLDVVTTRMRKTQALYQEREERKPPLEQALEHLGSFVDLGKTKVMGEGIDDFIKRLVHTASRLTDADRASLFVSDPVTGELWSKVAEGAGMKEIRVPAGVGIVGWVVKQGRILNVPEAYDDERFNPEVDRRTGYHTHTILCAPVRNADGKVFGAVQVINKNLGAFTGDDEALLRAFADQAAVAMDNLSVYRDLVRDHDRLARIVAVATTICRTANLEDLAATLGPQLRAFLHCNHVAIYWIEEEGGELWTVEGEQRQERRRPWGRGIAGVAAETRQLINIPDAYEDPRLDSELDVLPEDRTRSVLSVPIMNGGNRIVGVIQALNKVNAIFDDEDADLVVAVAAQIGISALAS